MPPHASPEPDLDAAESRLLKLLAIPGPSGQEEGIAQAIRDELLSAGAEPSSLFHDEAHRLSSLPDGRVGNLILRLPGARPGRRRLLMAHIDTVPLCVGCQPMVDGEWIRSADPKTALGGDDRAGATAILTAAVEVLRRGLPHPPLTFLWAVQEEVGLRGARQVRLDDLGRPELAFNWDGGGWNDLTVGANGGYRFEVTLTGRASHAGIDPAGGISAITIAGVAIAQLHHDGWLGLIDKNGRQGTSNIGSLLAQGSTNVVVDRARVIGEIRSHDPEFRKEILAAFAQAFEHAAQTVRASDGTSGGQQFQAELQYESFRIAEDAPSVELARQVLRTLDTEPNLRVTNGGLDANEMTAHGLPTVSLGCGQYNVHTVAETVQRHGFRQACRAARRLATCEDVDVSD